MATVAFHTLGCKVNFYETEGIWQLFQQEGYEQIDFEQGADVYVINTCTVTNTADKKSRQVIRRAIKRNPDAIVAVTGCYAQTAPAEVAAIPGVDLVVGTQDREKMMDYIKQFQLERQPINAVRNIMKTREFEELNVPTFADHTRAFLKIQEGCNNFCTFCIIPWTRGLLRSRKPESVIAQAHQLVASGYREIVLTGIHTGGYGEDLENYDLADLLRALEGVAGLQRIRISSIEASQITERVLDAFRASSKICRHFHIPLQAGDDEVLERMRRKYTTAEFREKIEHIKAIMPDVAITTDVIVGFPGESEEQFQNGYRFMQEIGFSEMHVFPYSKRNGTPAARMQDQVDDQVKNERVHVLIDLSDDMQLAYAERFVGQVLEMIPERPDKTAEDGTMLVGYSDNYIPIQIQAEASMIGQVCRVKLLEAGANGSKGQFLQVVSAIGLTDAAATIA